MQSAAAFAQDAWPTRPLRLVCGYPAGSSPDLQARLLAEPLAKALGQPIVVENKPGAGGNIGADLIAKSSDGHTIGIVGNGPLTSAQFLYSNLQYDPAKDLAPIALVGSAPLVWVVPKTAFTGAVNDYVKWLVTAGDNANYGSIGAGSGGHLGMELIKESLGVNPVHIPFPGGPQILNGMLAVRVPAENCVEIPKVMPIDIAALTEPMTVCAEAIDNANISSGERVLILGPGNIGQGAALFARAAGAEVTIVGKHDPTRLASLARMGFADCVDAGERPLDEALAAHLARGRFDAVIEATGSPAVVQQGLDLLKKRGTMVLVGIHPRPVLLNLTKLVREHQHIIGSYRAPIATWQRVVDFLSSNIDHAREMISHRLPLSQAVEGLELSRTKSASKVLVVQ